MKLITLWLFLFIINYGWITEGLLYIASLMQTENSKLIFAVSMVVVVIGVMVLLSYIYMKNRDKTSSSFFAGIGFIVVFSIMRIASGLGLYLYSSIILSLVFISYWIYKNYNKRTVTA